jgi:hypothetical protein
VTDYFLDASAVVRRYVLAAAQAEGPAIDNPLNHP